MGGEYAVKVTVRNGLILRRMKVLGIKSQTELARLSGLSITALNSLVTLRKAPRNKLTGEWVDAAFSLSSALQVEPEELWTETQQGMALKRNSYEVNMDEAQVQQLTSDENTDRLAIGSERSRVLKKALNSLTPREEQVVRRRFFEEETLADIASDWGVTSALIGHVENKALRKLRHPSRRLDKYFNDELRTYPKE
jgi:RNA polymerase sigma factor (sigma-70 family)